MPFFSCRGKFGQILIDIVILDYFGFKIIVFFDFEKKWENFRNFWKFRGFFRKKMPVSKVQISKILS